MRKSCVRPAVVATFVIAVLSTSCSTSSSMPTAPSTLVGQTAAFGSTIASATNGVSGATNALSDLAELRRMTVRYHDLDAAIAAGYSLAGEPCVPGMGIHAVNTSLVLDGVIDPMQPEVLLYDQLPNGKYRLMGVEYLIFESAVSTTPTVFGVDFYGPMPGHTPTMPTHYDLHVWIWMGNPDGTFSTTNRNVTCG